MRPFLLLATLALAACSGTTEPRLVRSEALAHGLELRLAVDRTVATPTAPLTATLTIVNHADTAVVVGGSPWCMLRLDVRDAAGEPVIRPDQVACTGVYETRTIPAWGELVEVMTWGGETMPPVHSARPMLPAGRYQLVALLDAGLGPQGGAPLRLATAPVVARLELP